MSLAVDRRRRVLWARHGARTRDGNEVRVSRWRVDRSWRRVSQRRTLIAGLPTTSGRHGGCRLLLDRTGPALLILRDNPYAGASTARRFVWTYGHRNVQGLAQRADGSVWSVEHGSDRDDEVNRLVRGGDYGWHPVPGYNESVPMTDQSLPGVQQEAAWSSGVPTIAPSCAGWVRGELLFLDYDRQRREGPDPASLPPLNPQRPPRRV